MSKGVDFSNPEALEAELNAAAAATDAKAEKGAKAPKEKKPAKPKMVKCPHCGEEFELPKSVSTRGVVSNIPLDEMTDDQLKIEYRNANSVYYKTKKKGGDITKSEARRNAVLAVMEAKGIQPTAHLSTATTAEDVAELIVKGVIKIEELQKCLDTANAAAATATSGDSTPDNTSSK